MSGTWTKSDFYFADDSVYDITEAGSDVVAAMDTIFATGDAVAVNVRNSSTKTIFVNRGGAVGATGVSALLLPFDTEVADAQNATITLSDATSVVVDFDQTTGNILIGGTPYGDGDHLVIDGRKVTVFETGY